jgi:glycosyltransferase involved in cell wall biosynthesis
VPLFPRFAGRSWQLALNAFSFAISASLFVPLLYRGKYDLIFAFEVSPVTVALPAILMRRVKRLPFLFWVQDLWPESLSATGAVSSPLALSMVRRFVRWVYRHSDLILVQSKRFIPRVVEVGADAARVRYFPNWAESLYAPMENVPSEIEASLPKGFRIVFAGNLGTAQSLGTIVAAATRLGKHSNIHWVIIGGGREEAMFRRLVADSGVANNVHLLGRKPVESMPGYFAAADTLLVTLRADPLFALTIPSKVQSYLACGRPVLGALDGEGADVIRESGAGIVVAASDDAELANAALDLYRLSPAERVVLGRNGRAYFERHFERERLVSQLESWMKDAVAEGMCVS